MILLYIQIFKVAKETENRKVGLLGAESNGRLLFNMSRVSVLQDERVKEIKGIDETLSIHLISLNGI